MGTKGFGKVSGQGGLLGGKPKKPVEQKQSRFSQAEMSLVTCLSEGPIEGLFTPTEPLKSIYVDKTVIQNADGSTNFAVNGWDYRAGVPWQDPMLGYADGVYQNTNIGQEVVFNLPITKTIINKNLDAVIVTVSVVSQEYPEAGGVSAAPINFRVWIRQGAGAWELRHDVGLNEVFASATPFEFNCPVNNFGGTVSQFQVRVERITPTDTITRFNRVVKWDTYQETIETKLRYPSLALMALRFSRADVENVGEVAFRLKARLVAIPSNAIVAADGGLNFSGLWDGTFYQPTKATRCPAMQLLDLLSNKRYGLGKRFKSSTTEKASFYAVSQYSNAFVPDGNGGFERRFQCDIVLDSKEDAKRVIDTFRTIFRGFAYYLDGAVRIGADMPSVGVVHQFTMADVEDGLFEYSDQVGLKGLNTRAIVWWNDPENFFERTPEYVEDREGIDLYGLNELEISLPGCSSQGQAHRAGLAALLGDRVRDLAVTFQSRLKGIMVLPGDTIQVADAKQANEETGGLIASVNDAAPNYITLDRPVTLQPNVNYVLFCTLPSGKVEERAVGGAFVGNLSTIAVWPLYSETPLPESNWVLASVVVQPQKFQVTNINPVEGSAYSLYEIQAVIYVDGFYAAVEQGLPLVPRSTRITAPTIVSLPRNVTAVLRFASGLPIVTVSWQFAVTQSGARDEFTESYLVEWRRGSGDSWGNTQSLGSLSYELQNPVEGVYSFRVAAVDSGGRQSSWVESSAVLVTKVNTYAVFTSPQTSIFAMD